MDTLSKNFINYLNTAEARDYYRLKIMLLAELICKKEPLNTAVIEHLFELAHTSEGEQECRLTLDCIDAVSPLISSYTLVTLIAAAYSKLLQVLRTRRTNEADLHAAVVTNFSNAFPTFEYVASQVKTKAGGFIDILAKERNTKRPVIIELKLKDKNCARQLYGYAVDFENPILISITEETVRLQQPDITYLLFKDVLRTFRYR